MNMNKDSRRRKRHTPPGPAGILFQTQQAASGKKSKKKNKKRQHHHHHQHDPHDDKNSLASSQVDEEHPYDRFNNDDDEKQLQNHQGRKPHGGGGFMTMSPSWAVMQQDLGLTTPYVDQLLDNYHHGYRSFSQGGTGGGGGNGGCDNDEDDDGDPHFHSTRRYNLLRPYMPNRFLLLLEIVRGQYDLGFGSDINNSNATNDNGNANGDYGTSDDLDDGYIYRSDEPALVVLVQSVQSSIHNNIWTVELTDETGSTLRAWIEPSFIQQQLQISAGLGQSNPSSQPESDKDSPAKTASAGDNVVGDTTTTGAELMAPGPSIKTTTSQEKEATSPSEIATRKPTKPTNQYIIRPGVVWLLRKVSIMPAIVSDRGLLTVAGNGRVERMLLISGKSIAKAWIPEDATIHEKTDSDDKQDKYSNWIQKRGDITSRIADEMDRAQNSNDGTKSNRREQHQASSDDENENIEDDREIQIDNAHINQRDGLVHANNHPIQSRVLNRELDTEMGAATTDRGRTSANHDRHTYNAVITPAPPNHSSNPYTKAGNVVTGSQHKRNFFNNGDNTTNNTSLGSSITTTNYDDRTKERPPVASRTSCDDRNTTSKTHAGSRSVSSISQSLAHFRHVPNQPETQSQAQSQFTASQQGNSQFSVTGRSQDHFQSQQMETQPCPTSNSFASQDLSGPEVENTAQTAAITTTTTTTTIRAENFQSPNPPSTQPKDDSTTHNNNVTGVHSSTPKVQSKHQTLVNTTNKEQRKSSEKKRKKKDSRTISFSPKTPIRKQHPIGSSSIWEAAVDDESIDALFDDSDGINDKTDHNVLDKEGKEEDKGESLQSDQNRIIQKPKGQDSIQGHEDIVEETESLTVAQKQSTKKSIFDIPLDDQDVNLDDFDL